MANKVFANGREVACKAASGKSAAAMPDACFSPPVPPPTGAPLPYPNTAYASDTTNGSKTVKITGKEVMLKDQSYFKKSTGDEAATEGLAHGAVTHGLHSKCYFTSWSEDVKFEGENADRHLDLMTHNHASQTGNTPPWIYADSMAAPAAAQACDKEKKKVAKKCSPEKDWKKNCPTPPQHPGPAPQNKASPACAVWKGNYSAYLDLYKDFAKDCQKNACLNARKCMLVPYDEEQCCPGQTPHHIVDGSSFLKAGTRKTAPVSIPGWGDYNINTAPCVCAEGPSWHTATHGEVHLRTGMVCKAKARGGMWSRQDATKAGAKAVRKTFPSSNCSQQCLEAQLNQYHDQAKTSDPEKPIRAVASKNVEKDPICRTLASDEMGV